MNLINEEKWNRIVELNKDSEYGGITVDVARRVMEKLDDAPEDFTAYILIHEANRELDAGITGFMAGWIAGCVSLCHRRGEEFRRSWNGEVGKATGQEDSEGVLNPAVMTTKE